MSDEQPEQYAKKQHNNTDLSDAAARLGAVGGTKGGPARARALSAEQRQAIARSGGLASAAKRRAMKVKIKRKGKPK